MGTERASGSEEQDREQEIDPRDGPQSLWEIERRLDRHEDRIRTSARRLGAVEHAIWGDGTEMSIGIDKKLDRILTAVKVGSFVLGPGFLLTLGIEVFRITH